MAANEYSVDVKPRSAAEGGGFIAVVPQLPGCNGYGATPEEAARNAIDAIARFLSVKPAGAR
jgi:predicted RNase H-like HicB family nuclease